MTMLVKIETQFARSIAYGVERRGSLVSSARSAAPSQPSSTNTGSSAARPIAVRLICPPPTGPLCTRTLRPWECLKKKSAPTSRIAAAISEPASSKLTPKLFTIAVTRMLMRFNTSATAVTIPASSTTFAFVGACQNSGAKTVEMVTATTAVPVTNASQHAQPVN